MVLRRLFLGSVLLGVLVSFSSAGFAQESYYGSIVGNVVDETGKVIPGAEVTVISSETGVSRTVVTSEEGLYRVRNLNPGTYRVEVSLPGFKRFVRDNVIVGGGREVRENASLQIGDIADEVTVRGTSTLITTENPTRKDSVSHEATVTIPNKSTAFQVFPDVYNQLFLVDAEINNSAFIIAGSIGATESHIVDGMRVENQSSPVGGSRGLARPSIEAVSELVIVKNNASARYARPAAYELVLKGGGNDLHGSFWYEHGNKSLNAFPFFFGIGGIGGQPGRVGLLKPPFILHQYGASAGGPIVKDKTFFFGSFQGFYFPNGEFWQGNVPTLKMRQGDFSELLDPDFLSAVGFSEPIQLVDPVTREPIPGNVIPPSMLSPVALNILREAIPEPNTTTSQGWLNNFTTGGLLVRKESNFDVRLDHFFSPNHQLYGRFMYFHSPNWRSEAVLPKFGGNHFIYDNRSLTIHDTVNFSSNLTNDLMFGYFNSHFPGGPGAPDETDELALPWNSILGIEGISPERDKGFPLITLSQTALSMPISFGPTDLTDRFYEIADNLVWVKGNHSVQSGFNYRQSHQGSDLPGVGQSNAFSCEFGCATFNGRWTNLDIADFMLGFPFSSARFVNPPADFRNRNEWSGYIQDDWKVNPKLTLNLGLRYDYFPAIRSENDLMAMFDPASGRLIVPTQRSLQAIPQNLNLPIPVVTAAEAGFEESLLVADKNDWQPRFGVAYRITDDTVIRGGIGSYRSPLTVVGSRLLTGPFAVREDFPVVQPATGEAPVITLSDPFHVEGQGSSIINFFAPEPRLSTPRYYDFSLSVDHQIGDHVFEAGYVGKTARIPFRFELNAVPPSDIPFSRDRLPFPDLGSITGMRNGASYAYHAMRLSAKRRFADGLMFDGTYVWNKTLETGGTISNAESFPPEDPFDLNRDKAQSGLVPPHRFTGNFIWQLPFGRWGALTAPDRGFGRAVNQIASGWELAGNFNLTKNAPLNVTTTFRDADGNPIDAPNTNRFSGRPDRTGEAIDNVPSGFVFNPNAFSSQVPTGRYGNAGRNLIPGVFRDTYNLSIFRNFQLPWWFAGDEGAKLRLGAHWFNAFNHLSPLNPITNMDSPFFGQNPSGKGGQNRTIQLALRIDY